jgi:hypothetical protein
MQKVILFTCFICGYTRFPLSEIIYTGFKLTLQMVRSTIDSIKFYRKYQLKTLYI